MKKKIISTSNNNEHVQSGAHASRVAENMKENLKKRKAQARAQGRAPIKKIKEI